jgi:hypothetical protein
MNDNGDTVQYSCSTVLGYNNQPHNHGGLKQPGFAGGDGECL